MLKVVFDPDHDAPSPSTTCQGRFQPKITQSFIRLYQFHLAFIRLYHVYTALSCSHFRLSQHPISIQIIPPGGTLRQIAQSLALYGHTVMQSYIQVALLKLRAKSHNLWAPVNFVLSGSMSHRAFSFKVVLRAFWFKVVLRAKSHKARFLL